MPSTKWPSAPPSPSGRSSVADPTTRSPAAGSSANSLISTPSRDRRWETRSDLPSERRSSPTLFEPTPAQGRRKGVLKALKALPERMGLSRKPTASASADRESLHSQNSDSWDGSATATEASLLQQGPWERKGVHTPSLRSSFNSLRSATSSSRNRETSPVATVSPVTTASPVAMAAPVRAVRQATTILQSAARPHQAARPEVPPLTVADADKVLASNPTGMWVGDFVDILLRQQPPPHPDELKALARSHMDRVVALTAGPGYTGSPADRQADAYKMAVDSLKMGISRQAVDIAYGQWLYQEDWSKLNEVEAEFRKEGNDPPPVSPRTFQAAKEQLLADPRQSLAEVAGQHGITNSVQVAHLKQAMMGQAIALQKAGIRLDTSGLEDQVAKGEALAAAMAGDGTLSEWPPLGRPLALMMADLNGLGLRTPPSMSQATPDHFRQGRPQPGQIGIQDARQAIAARPNDVWVGDLIDILLRQKPLEECSADERTAFRALGKFQLAALSLMPERETLRQVAQDSLRMGISLDAVRLAFPLDKDLDEELAELQQQLNASQVDRESDPAKLQEAMQTLLDSPHLSMAQVADDFNITHVAEVAALKQTVMAQALSMGREVQVGPAHVEGLKEDADQAANLADRLMVGTTISTWPPFGKPLGLLMAELHGTDKPFDQPLLPEHTLVDSTDTLRLVELGVSPSEALNIQLLHADPAGPLGDAHKALEGELSHRDAMSMAFPGQYLVELYGGKGSTRLACAQQDIGNGAPAAVALRAHGLGLSDLKALKQYEKEVDKQAGHRAPRSKLEKAQQELLGGSKSMAAIVEEQKLRHPKDLAALRAVYYSALIVAAKNAEPLASS